MSNEDGIQSVVSELNQLVNDKKESKDAQEKNKGPYSTSLNSATGIESFDELLSGGFPQGAVILLAGSSGSGKTIFTFQWLFEGIKHDENAVYISLTEPLFKIVENLEKMNYYNRDAIEQQRLKIIDLREYFPSPGYNPQEILDFIEDQVKENHAKRLCIDSITAIAYQYNDKAQIRSFIFELGKILATLGCTTILTSEVADNTRYSIYEVEEFISDAILRLDQIQVKSEFERQMKLVKVRGKSFTSEAIPMKITSDGINLFPKIRPKLESSAQTGRVSTGIRKLDEMFHGGLIKGSSTLAVGATGTGKTILSLKYMLDGLENNETCAFFGFEESREQLIRNAEGFGWDLQQYEKNGTLHLYCSYPKDKLLEEHFEGIKNCIEENSVSRCVIDSFSALSHEFDESAFSSFANRLNGFLKNHDITSLFTATTGNLIGSAIISEHNLSTLTDAIVMLRYVEMQGKLESVINILKMRGSDHYKDLCIYSISNKGLSIGESLSGYEGVMTGSSKKIRELQEESERLKTIIAEKEQTQNQLRKITRAIEQSPTSIVITDTNGAIEYVNPAFSKITGYSEKETIGKNPRILKSDEHGPEFYKELWDTITAGDIWHGSIYNKKKNGEFYWEQASISPIFDKQNHITNYVAVKEDITQQKIAEEKVKENEEQLKTLFNTIQAGVIVVDETTHEIININPAAAKLVGKSKEDIIGKICHDVLCPAEKGKCPITDLGKTVDNSEKMLIDKNGNKIPILKTVNKAVMNGRNCLIESFVDISIQKHAEEKLKHSNKELDDIIDTSPDGIRIVCKDFKVKKMNKAMEEMTGVSREKGIGMLCREMSHSENCGTSNCFMARILKEGKRIESESVRENAKGEKRFYLEVVSPWLDDKGNIIGIIEDFRDITDLKKAEQALKDSKSHFKNLFDHMVDPVVIIDSKGVFLDINEKVEEITGFSKKELLGKNFLKVKIATKKSKAIMIKNLAKRLAGMKVGKYEVEIITKDGNTMPFEINAVKIEYIDKAADLVVLRDISDRKEKEEKLIEAQNILSMINKRLKDEMARKTQQVSYEKNMYQNILEQAPQKIFQKNNEMKYIYVNKHFADLYQMNPDEFIGKTDDELIDKNIAKQLSASDKKILTKKASYVQDEVFLSKEKSPIHILKTPLYDEKGSVNGIIGISMEYKDHKKNKGW